MQAIEAMSLTLLIATAGVATTTYLAIRDHRAAIQSRRGLLNDCANALDRSTLVFGEDGFPKLSGSHKGRGARIELVLDTMTIRRLPQLWLSTTLLERRPGLPGFDVLVRHAGNEFYSLTSHFERQFDAPRGLPHEVLIRGDVNAGPLIAYLAPLLSKVLEDPRIKEVAVTERGLRIVRQAAEGKRGEHLLLRQSVFPGAKVTRSDLAALLEQLHAMSALIDEHRQAYAA